LSSSEASELYKAIKEGDHLAFRIFYTENWKTVFSATYRMARSEELSKDLVQEAFLTIWEKRDQIEPNSNLPAYLYRIIKNNFLNHIRREENFAQKHEAIIQTNNAVVPDPYDQLAAQELAVHVASAVAEMPDGMRKVWKMSRHEYLSIEEISRDLSISPLTVKKQISNALQLVRSKLRILSEK